jgi:hypothetical protein
MIGSRSASSSLLGPLRVVVGFETGFAGAITRSVALSLLTSGFRVVFFVATGTGGVAGLEAAALVVLVDGAAVVGVLVLVDARVATFGFVDMAVAWKVGATLVQRVRRVVSQVVERSRV